MSDIKLNESTNDIEVINGVVSLTSNNAETVRQKLSIVLKTFKGEWFVNSEVGIPYFQDILKSGVSKFFVDSLLKKAINETKGVFRITSFTSSINRSTRVYTASFTCTTKDGEAINFEV